MKATCLVYALYIVAFSSSAQNLNDNLLIYYPFDGNENDQSGNGFHGSANATLVPDQFGNPNSAYHFNGIDEFIDFPFNAALQPQLPISFSFWINFDNLDPTNAVFATNYAQNKHSGVWMSPGSSGQVAIAYGRATGGSSDPDRRAKVGTTSLQPGTWYLVTGVIRGATDMDIYIDCVNDGGTYAGTCVDPIGYTSDPGSLGRKDLANLAPYYFEGSINDFRYWDRALELSDIDALCNSFLNVQELTQENAQPQYLIFPNPAKDMLQIQGESDRIERVEILDFAGKLIVTSSGQNSIPLSNLHPGIYLIRLMDANNSLIQMERLIVE